MKKIHVFLESISNRLTGGNPYREDALGALLGALLMSLFGWWKIAAVVATVSLLYRIWEGPSGKSWLYYAAKTILSILAVRFLLWIDVRSLTVFPMAYWLIFAALSVGYIGYARHFFLSAAFLFAVMLLALSGSEETALITAALMGAVCGFFPKKKRNGRKNVKFV